MKAAIGGWQLARTAPGACADPSALAAQALEWQPAKVPGTVASALHRDIGITRDYDADDWWYRTTFPAAPGSAPRHFLHFEGLATLADVWLNGEPILESRNMFLAHRVEVTGRLRDVNQLVIRFASLRAAMERRQPRARWKTALVRSQALRAFRTTLLGRMPGWTPSIPPVGPWRAILLEASGALDLAGLELRPRAQGGRGLLEVRASIDGEPRVEAARIVVAEAAHGLSLTQGHDLRVHGDLDLGAVPLWWPHTHGAARRLPWRLELNIADRWTAVAAGHMGFRELQLDTRDAAVRFVLNGVPVFCRGACWATEDILALQASPERLRATLRRARDAGLNMLRVGGTMAYESGDFYEACDELGILVWQDFMFASMDYPVGDPAFAASVQAEARQQLQRLQRHGCVVAYCGNSEVAQQAAMLGLESQYWSNALFDDVLPGLVAEHHPGVPYFPSTPTGGALPFHVGSGLAHYYGVGAYRRPLADAKTARVRFATECLAFAHVPEPETIAAIGAGALPPPTHPAWKARVPRDNGAGWDFEDVRDHYLRELYRVDPLELRSRDLARYYALSRSVTGEVIRRVFAEWRSQASGCGGALVWMYQDAWAGAGWGLVASDGTPKAAWWHARRAWAPRAIHLTDEGLDGAALHIVNDHAEALAAVVEVVLVREDGAELASARRTVEVAGHGSVSLSADALLARFTDIVHAYRFGPPAHAVVAARLLDTGGAVLSEDCLFPSGHSLPPCRDARLHVDATQEGEDVIVRLACDRFLQGVSVSCAGHDPDDNHFHLLPQREKVIRFRARDGGAAFEAELAALNTSLVAVARLGEPTGAANREPATGSNPFVA